MIPTATTMYQVILGNPSAGSSHYVWVYDSSQACPLTTRGFHSEKYGQAMPESHLSSVMLTVSMKCVLAINGLHLNFKILWN